MSVLLKEIKKIDQKAALELEKLKFCKDSDIQTLTRDDLKELFPGTENLRLRKTIFELINKQKPVNIVLNELKEFIPRESFRAALTSNGVLVDYLHILKDMKTQMNNVQTFLDAHISLLEDISKPQPDQESSKGSLSGMSASCDPVNPPKHQTTDPPNAVQVGTYDAVCKPSTGTPQHSARVSAVPNAYHAGLAQKRRAAVMFKMVVSGKTFDAHLQLLDRIKCCGQEGDSVWLSLERSPNNQDGKITIVFCPIVSRVGADVDAAMRAVTGDEPVILVLMHHKHGTQTFSSMRTWSHHANIVLHANVIYHETVGGLVKCKQNDESISVIRKELLKYSSQTTEVASENALAVVPECDGRGSTAPRSGGSTNKPEKRSSGFSFFPNFMNYKS